MGLAGKALFGFVIIFSAILIGALAGLGGKLPTLLGVAAIGGGFLVAWPRFSLWFVVLGALIFGGLIDLYLPSLGMLRWMVAGVSIALIFVSLVTRSGENTRLTPKAASSSVLSWAFIFFIAVLTSSLFQGKPTLDWVVGMKGYFQVWGLLLGLAWLAFGRQDAERLLNLLPWFALLQFPFVLHQFFFLVPERSGLLEAARGVVAVDIVAGTFGGSAEGGGRSTLLALAQIVAITLLVARWRVGQLSLAKTCAGSVVFIAPLFFSEVKILFVILPLAMALLFRDKLISNPVRSLVGASFIFALLALMLSVYSSLPGAKSQRAVSIDKFLEQSVSYNFGDQGYGNSILNRTTVYSFWFKENLVRGQVTDALFGHGPGASSNSSSLARNNIASIRYPGYSIGLTALSALLWDFGLFGTVAAIGLILSAYLGARRMASERLGQPTWAIAKTTQIGIALIGLTLLHSNYFVFDMAFQALLMIFVGYVVVYQRYETDSRK